MDRLYFRHGGKAPSTIDKLPDEVSGKKIIILDIEDDYRYMDKDFIGMIKLSVDPFL